MTDADDRPVLRLAHSPDPDDVFMWWPLFSDGDKPPALDTGRFRYEPLRLDVESLNVRAETLGDLEITALSCAQYPRVADRYAITACGASMGDGYGPKLVACSPMTPEDLRAGDVTIAVPGERTSAFGALSLLLGPGSFRHETVPFDAVVDLVASGRYPAGVVIHEGQLTYGDAALHLIRDLGAWWREERSLPLPLGVNAVRRDLVQVHRPGTLTEIASTLRRSVDYALEHRDASVRAALEFARGLDPDLADRFVAMYVNRWTLDFGPTGQEAVKTFLGALHQAGLTPRVGDLDLVEVAGA